MSVEEVLRNVVNHVSSLQLPSEFLRLWEGNARGKDEHYEEKVRSLPPEWRPLAVAANDIITRFSKAEAAGACLNCWLPSDRCMCSIFGVKSRTPHHLHIFMKHNELLKRSNTGKLILNTFSNVSLYVRNIQRDEEKLLRLLREQKERTFVLYPGENSITVSQFMERKNLNPVEYALHIILVDSTWRAGKNMRKFFPPDTTFVKLKESRTMKTSALVRKKTRPDGVCTADALCLLLNEMRFPSSCYEMLETAENELRQILKGSLRTCEEL